MALKDHLSRVSSQDFADVGQKAIYSVSVSLFLTAGSVCGSAEGTLGLAAASSPLTVVTLC